MFDRPRVFNERELRQACHHTHLLNASSAILEHKRPLLQHFVLIIQFFLHCFSTVLGLMDSPSSFALGVQWKVQMHVIPSFSFSLKPLLSLLLCFDDFIHKKLNQSSSINHDDVIFFKGFYILMESNNEWRVMELSVFKSFMEHTFLVQLILYYVFYLIAWVFYFSYFLVK